MSKLLNPIISGLQTEKKVYDELNEDYPDLKKNIDFNAWKSIMNEEYQKYKKETKNNIDYATWLVPDGKMWFIEEYIEPVKVDNKIKYEFVKKNKKSNYRLIGGIIAGSLVLLTIATIIGFNLKKSKNAIIKA